MMHNISSAQTDADNFYRSDAVTAEKVSFPNQYKMKVGANLFRPKEMKPGEKRPAIIVGHPMGAVKEQAANLYAIKMAERGFVTLAIDLSFWGDSEGERATRSPLRYTPRISARRRISSERGSSSSAAASAQSESAAAEVSP